MNRRDLIKGGATAAATLALSPRAFAQSLNEQFDRAFTTPAPTPPLVVPPVLPVPPPLPTVLVPDPAYDRRVLALARREVERAGAQVWRRDIVGIADFARPSTLPRLHFANLENGTIRSFYVAHGRGSDPDHSGFLRSFSNLPGSEATSRGGYLTAEWYKGKYGTSIRLLGLDGDNSAALNRAIVMHPATYAAPEHIARFGKLGRSEGCFAMAPGSVQRGAVAPVGRPPVVRRPDFAGLIAGQRAGAGLRMSSTAKEPTMAKGQMKSSRETRKPKKEKPPKPNASQPSQKGSIISQINQRD